MKKITLLLLTFFFVVLEATNSYEQTKIEHLQALTWEEEEWPNESFSDYLRRCFTYQSEMQEFRKRKITFQLFSKAQTNLNNSLYDAITARDVNLLFGAKKHDSYIAQIVDRTDTVFGKIFLYNLLNNPTDSIAILKERQNIIKTLLAQQEFYDHVKQEIMESLAATENIMLSFWASQDGFLQASQRAYFSVPFFKGLEDLLNESPLIVGTKSVYGHQTRILQSVIEFGATVLLPLYALSRLSNYVFPESLEPVVYRCQGAGGPILGALTCLSNDGIVAGASVATAVYTGLFFKENVTWEHDMLLLESLLQKKMNIVSQFFKSINDLLALLKEHPAVVEQIPCLKKLQEYVYRMVRQEKVEKLLNLLYTKTFQDESSLLAHRGNILVAYRLMHQLKEEFEPLLPLLGELDAYLSCATLYKEFVHKRVSFCFAEFKEAAQPSVAAKKFWNPLIDQEKVVPNSVELGAVQRRNMIITGPNAGGKSSLIKALVINLLLAQSIGFAAAQEFVLTPFYKIATYLNIVDDIAAGNSLFKAQVLRAQEIVFLVENTPQNLFNFVALDEMFNGTSAKESEAAAYSVAQYIGKFPNTICVIATHYPLLTMLEKETDSFANYKVSVTLNANQGIFCPFKLEPGISQQHIALNILKEEGFDNAIIQQALELLK